MLAVDGHGLPGEGIDAVEHRIHHDIETADVIGANAHLYDGNAVHHARLVEQRVRMPADNEVNAPCRVELGCELFVFLKPNVREQHREVDIESVIGVADAADFLEGILRHHERTGDPIVFASRNHGFGDDANEEDLHAANLDDMERLEQPRVIRADTEVRADNGKIRALFEEQHVGYTVIHLVVADGGHIGRQHVHDLNRRQAVVFRVDKRTPEHVARNRIHDVFLFTARFLDVAGQHRDAADQLVVDLIGKKIAVHVVGVEQRELPHPQRAVYGHRLLQAPLEMLCCGPLVVFGCRGPQVPPGHLLMPPRHVLLPQSPVSRVRHRRVMTAETTGQTIWLTAAGDLPRHGS